MGRGLCQRDYFRWRRHGDPTATARPTAQAQRAWLVDAIGSATDACINWPFGRRPDGYGKVGGTDRRAHREALSLVQPWCPPMPPNVLHSCDNPPCVNPRHLSWGTQGENLRQAYARKRRLPNGNR